MSHITSFEVSALFKKLQDILYFYGFNKQEIMDLLDYQGNFDEFSDEKLLEMEGVTNAILFHLKYKM